MPLKQLIGQRVLIKPTPDDPERKSKGGIYIPSTVKEPLLLGVVRAIGHEAEVVKVGDEVYYHAHVGSPITVDEEECLIVNEKLDIVAVV